VLCKYRCEITSNRYTNNKKCRKVFGMIELDCVMIVKSRMTNDKYHITSVVGRNIPERLVDTQSVSFVSLRQ